MKAIVQNNVIVDDVKQWNSRYYTDKASELGFCVSMPVTEPIGVLQLGDYKIMPVEEVKPSIDTIREEFTGPEVTILEDKVVMTYGKRNLPEPPPEPPLSVNQPYTGFKGTYFDEAAVVERKKYENQYMVLTKQIMQLAGMTVGNNEWPKLTDQEYQTVGLQASINNASVGNFLLLSLAYIHRTLKTDFEWKWEDYAFRPEVL